MWHLLDRLRDESSANRLRLVPEMLRQVLVSVCLRNATKNSFQCEVLKACYLRGCHYSADYRLFKVCNCRLWVNPLSPGNSASPRRVLRKRVASFRKRKSNRRALYKLSKQEIIFLKCQWVFYKRSWYQVIINFVQLLFEIS